MISRGIVHMLCQSASFLTAMTELPVMEAMAIKYTKYQLSIRDNTSTSLICNIGGDIDSIKLMGCVLKQGWKTLM